MGEDRTGPPSESPRDKATLVSEMRGRLDDLREQLQAERQAHTETRRMLNAALERQFPHQETKQRKLSSLGGMLGWVRGRARDRDADSHLFWKVLLLTYVPGWVLIWVVAGIGAYAYLHPADNALLLAPRAHFIVAWGFGVYAGVRDGIRYPFGFFLCVGLVTAIAATSALAIISVVDQEKSFEVLLTLRNLVVMGAAFITHYFLFVFGAMVGQALAKTADNKVAEQEGRKEMSEDASGSHFQAWVGLVGTIITAIVQFFGVLIQTFTNNGGGV